MFSDFLWISYAAQSPSSDVSVRAFVGTQACLLLQMTVGLLSPSCRMPSVSHVISRAAVSSASTWASSTTCRVGSPWARVRRPPFLSPGEGGRAELGEPGGCPSFPSPSPCYRGWGAAWGGFPQPPSLPPCTGRGLASPAAPSQLWWPVPRTEIFSGKSVAHEDIKYEQACILYNLGELPRPFPGAPLLPALPISAEDTWILTPPPPHPGLPSALPASWAAGSPLVGEALRGCLLLECCCVLWAQRWPLLFVWIPHLPRHPPCGSALLLAGGGLGWPCHQPCWYGLSLGSRGL